MLYIICILGFGSFFNKIVYNFFLLEGYNIYLYIFKNIFIKSKILEYNFIVKMNKFKGFLVIFVKWLLEFVVFIF